MQEVYYKYLKKADAKLLVQDQSHENYYWSNDVSKAIAQLEKCIFWASQQSANIEKEIKEVKKREIKIVKPKGLLEIGSRKEFSDNKKWNLILLFLVDA